MVAIALGAAQDSRYVDDIRQKAGWRSATTKEEQHESSSLQLSSQVRLSLPLGFLHLSCLNVLVSDKLEKEMVS